MNNVIAIARLELMSAARLKWMRLLAAAFALLAVAMAYSAGSADDVSGAEGLARTTVALIPVSLILVPLAAVILGVSGQAGEEGESFLFAQPIGREAIVSGRWLGQTAALGSAIIAGFGVGAAVIVSNAGTTGFAAYAAFVAASVVLAAIFVSIASAIAATSAKRLTAIAAGVFTWFFFVLLYDGVALSLAGTLNGRIGGRVLLGSVFANPVDLIRITVLRIAGTASALGAAGEAWTRFLGGDIAANAIATLALMMWVALPVTVAMKTLKRRDL